MGGILGKKKSSKTTTDKKEENSNWLMKNAAYTGLANQGIKEGSQMSIPDQQLAEYGENFYRALNNMGEGVDLSDYARYQGFYDDEAQSQLSAGNRNLAGATDTLTRIQNMSGDQWRDEFSQEYDSDLVRSRIDQVSQTYRDQEGLSLQSLNQGAVASGNMGSSRAGVAEGVIRSNTAKNIASATVDIQAQEEQLAEQRLMNRYGLNQGAASTMASIGQGQIGQGYNLTSAAFGVSQALNQARISNWNNSIYAGQVSQGIEQQRLDLEYQNNLRRQSPSLARLGYMNQFLGPMANYQTFGNSTTTTTTPAQKSGFMGTVLGAAGTAVGAYFGGPIGAQVGGAVGGAVGNAI
ncbi:hypothetical protein IFY90_004255 [Salmonella enterica]|nr:hypothetical protein [Salmonella enterica]